MPLARRPACRETASSAGHIHKPTCWRTAMNRPRRRSHWRGRRKWPGAASSATQARDLLAVARTWARSHRGGVQVQDRNVHSSGHSPTRRPRSPIVRSHSPGRPASAPVRQRARRTPPPSSPRRRPGPSPRRRPAPAAASCAQNGAAYPDQKGTHSGSSENPSCARQTHGRRKRLRAPRTRFL